MKALTKYAATLLATSAFASSASAAEILVSADITTSTTWTANNTYNLQNQIYVKNGATLTIEAGTIIASTPTANGSGSLAITQGSQIFACGTKDAPIIFTSTADVATWTGGDPRTGVWREAANEWGNLTIMGQAFISEDVEPDPGDPNVPFCDAGNVGQMEGLVPDFVGDPDTIYGGGDDDDDSGKLEYVSIRYGGRVIGLANELNGLSLGGIGRGTDINHVEIMNNVDDGIEIWGGTVALKYVSIMNIGDDSFDVDQGWRGKAQFVNIIQGYSLDASQGSGVGDNCFEIDGAEQSDYQPVTTAVIYNATVIGNPDSGDGCTTWRDNARVQYRNCVFVDIGDELVRFDNIDGDGGQGYGHNGTLSWADTWTTSFSATSTVNPCPNPSLIYTAQVDGNLAEIKDSVFFNIADTVDATAVGVFAGGNNNTTAGSMPLMDVTRGAGVVKGGLFIQPVVSVDPRPATGGPAATSVGTAPNDGFFTPANYRGAFAPATENWLCGWTAIDAFGFLSLPGSTVSRNPGGVNANALTGSTLSLGDPFTFTVDTSITGHLLTVVFGLDSPFTFPLQGGATNLLCFDLGGSGELLGFTTTAGPTAVFNGVVPALADLCGFDFCAQAVMLGGVIPYKLSNALDVVVGN